MRHRTTGRRGRNQAGYSVERGTGEAHVLFVLRVGFVAVGSQPEAPVELVLEAGKAPGRGGDVDQQHFGLHSWGERAPPVNQSHPVLPLDLLQGPCGRSVLDAGDAVV